MNKSLIFAVGALGALSAPALARDEVPSGTPAAVGALYDCRAIAEALARLACYDRTVAALAVAQADKEIVFADREQMREVRKGLFGFALPRIRLFGGGGGDDKDEEVEFKELTTTIARTGELASGRWFFVLPEGARWEQIDSTILFADPKKGDTIAIRQAAFGSYLANIAGRRAIRVKRVE